MKLLALIVFVAIISSAICDYVPTDTEAIELIDRLDNEKSLELFGGLRLDKIEGGDDSPRSEGLLDRAVRYIKTHQVNFELEEARSSNVGEARGKLKKLLVPLLLALKFKSAVILPIVFTILALISLKALKVGLVALLLAGSSFVKDLLAKKQEKVTTAYISAANPGASGFNAEIVTDWNRNGPQSAVSNDLAYNAYNTNYQTLPQNI